jgi:hypothetical protein
VTLALMLADLGVLIYFIHHVAVHADMILRGPEEAVPEEMDRRDVRERHCLCNLGRGSSVPTPHASSPPVSPAGRISSPIRSLNPECHGTAPTLYEPSRSRWGL